MRFTCDSAGHHPGQFQAIAFNEQSQLDPDAVDLFDRPMPSDTVAEKSVLGAIIGMPGLLDTNRLHRALFHNEGCQVAFDTLCEMRRDGLRITEQAVASALTRTDWFDPQWRSEHAQTAAEFVREVARHKRWLAMNVDQFIARLHELERRRWWWLLGMRILQAAHDGSLSPLHIALAVAQRLRDKFSINV